MKTLSFKGKSVLNSFLLVVVLFFGYMLISGTARSVSEAQIVKDLQSSPYFFPAQEVTITAHEIIKRQTSKESKTDVVYITVDASNDDIQCKLSYVMTYNLYNEGWILDTVRKDYASDWYVTPLHGVPDSAVQMQIDYLVEEGAYDSIVVIGHRTNLGKNEGTDIIYLEATKDHLYGVETISLSQTWTFDAENTYTFVDWTGFSDEGRTLELKDTIVGASWINLDRYSGTYDLFVDRFDIYISGLISNDGVLKADIVKSDVFAQWWNGLEAPPQSMMSVDFHSSAWLAYHPIEEKWGIPLNVLSGIFYSETDSDDFDSTDFFVFDLDIPGKGEIAHTWNWDTVSFNWGQRGTQSIRRAEHSMKAEST